MKTYEMPGYGFGQICKQCDKDWYEEWERRKGEKEKKPENIHETIYALKSAVALLEYVRDLEKTDHAEINDVIYFNNDFTAVVRDDETFYVIIVTGRNCILRPLDAFFLVLTKLASGHGGECVSIYRSNASIRTAQIKSIIHHPASKVVPVV